MGSVSFFDKAREKIEGMLSGEPVALESAADQPDEDKQLVAWVRSKLDERSQTASRAANEATWLENIAYLCGIDSVRFDLQTRRFMPVNTVPRVLNKSRVHVNKVLPTIQNKLAKLCKNQPRWDVRPKSSDDADKEAARLGKAVILQDWDNLKISKRRLTLLMWAMECGHSYAKVSWDTSAGPAAMLEGERVTEGDKRVDIFSPFGCYPDPLASELDEAQDFIQAKVRPLSYFAESYDRGALVKEEDVWLNALSYELRVNQMSQGGSESGTAQQQKNTAIEIAFYEKPSKKHPQGRHVIIANGVLLKDGVLPIDELPFVKFDDIKIAGKYASEATITHIRPMQDQYNRNKTLKAAFLNRTLMGKFIAARGHGLSAEAVNDQSGEVVEYDPVPGEAPPSAMQTPTMPQYVFQEDESLISDINDVSGINQVSRGQLPSSSIPAIGMQMLVEQDDTRIGIETENHEHAYADLGRILLKFTAKYYTKERLLREVGQGFDYVVRKFKGEDLRDNFDVHVIRGSTVPGSKVLERDNIMKLHQGGYLGNPTDPKVIENALTMMEYGDEFEPWKRHSLTMQSIKRGLEQIEQGIKPAVSEFDNHPMWIQELDMYRLTEKFLQLDDEKKGLLIQTMEDHVTELQKMTSPQTMENPDTAPDLQPTDAAQQMEGQVQAEAPPDGQVPQIAPEPPQAIPTQTEVMQ